MADRTTNTPSVSPPKEHWYSGFSNYIGYLMAGVATVTSAVADVERHFHKNYFEGTGVFAWLRQQKDIAYEVAVGESGDDKALLVRKISDIEKKFYVAEKQAAKKDLNVHNTLDKWLLIKPHQRLEVSLKMATIMSLAVGAIFTIKRNKSLTARVQYHEKTKDEAIQEQAERQAIADAMAGRLPGTEKFAEQLAERKEEPRHYAAVDTMAADANALKAEPKRYPAVDDLAARVQQHARDQEPAMAQRG